MCISYYVMGISCYVMCITQLTICICVLQIKKSQIHFYIFFLADKLNFINLVLFNRYLIHNKQILNITAYFTQQYSGGTFFAVYTNI